ncbi:MAG TPA: AAA family ATPase, partial [Propionibacteriaceae bacterium]|nr:AAA family ATPase [Propionibacteriaceae bacterium]
LGKSLLTVKLVADVTRGDLEDQPATALLLSAEDSRQHVVTPRLIAAGADLTRVHFDDVHDKDGFPRPLSFPDDVNILEEMVKEYEVSLVVIDPLMAHLTSSVDSWKDQSVRRALAPLARLAEASGAAVLLVSHLNKGQSNDPLRRLGGSVGLSAAARSVMLLGHDPDDPDGGSGSRRVLAHVKSNVGELSESLLYNVESARVTYREVELETARISHLGVSPHGGGELLESVEERSVSSLSEEVSFLQQELADGPRPAQEVSVAAERAGLSWDRVKRAKSRAGARSFKERVQNGRWMLELTGNLNLSSALKTSGE